MSRGVSYTAAGHDMKAVTYLDHEDPNAYDASVIVVENRLINYALEVAGEDGSLRALKAFKKDIAQFNGHVIGVLLLAIAEGRCVKDPVGMFSYRDDRYTIGVANFVDGANHAFSVATKLPITEKELIVAIEEQPSMEHEIDFQTVTLTHRVVKVNGQCVGLLHEAGDKIIFETNQGWIKQFSSMLSMKAVQQHVVYYLTQPGCDLIVDLEGE